MTRSGGRLVALAVVSSLELTEVRGRTASDTIDLQDPKAPSAKDHSRQPHRPSPLGGGPSPHQADALRHAEKEAASAQQRSPRVSWVEGDGFAPDGQAILVRQDHDQDPDQDDDGRAGAFDDDATTIADDGTSDSPPDDMTLVDGDDDDGLDDDLLQNMSSSPSIDDGGYHTSSSRLPARTDPLRRRPNSSSPSSPPPSSSSPLSTPNRLGFSPSILSRSRRPPSYQHQMEGEVEEGMVHHRHRHRHRRRGDSRGGRGGIDDRSDGTRPGAASPIHRRAIRCQFDGSQESHRTDPHDDSLDGLGPAGEDSLLDRGLDQLASDSHDREYGSGGIEIDNAPGLDRDDDDDDDDDDGFGVDDDDDDDDDDDHIYTFDLDNDTDGTDDVFFSDDPRFIDYGWGAKCLHVAEDIDFEFVYALRSFTATVEGQANASKGETMVLLDDTNSYWWLVRVVKDSSIGSSLGLAFPTCGCWHPSVSLNPNTFRLPSGRRHRNADGATGAAEQAPEHRRAWPRRGDAVLALPFLASS